MTPTPSSGPRPRDHELTILNRIAGALNAAVDPVEAVETALEEILRRLDLETGWVWLLNPDTGASFLAASRHLPAVLAGDPRSLEGSCTCLGAYTGGRMGGPEVFECSRLQEHPDATGGYRFHASIPVDTPGERLGLLNVASRDWRELSPDELALLGTVADMLALTLTRARLHDAADRRGEERERRRLAREIHDTVARTLAGLTWQLESADALLEDVDGTAPGRRILGEALAGLRGSLEEVRRAVLDLRVPPLENRTLGAALHALAAEYGERGLEVDFTHAGADRPLPPRVESAVYRVAQEALENVLRHAGIATAGLDLLATPETLALTVSDAGRGFEPEAVERARFGLRGIRERAHLLGGTFSLETEPGRGTTLRIQVPLGTAS